MRRRPFFLIVFVLLSALSAGSPATATACGGGWYAVATTTEAELYSVDALGPSDAWAVGYTFAYSDLTPGALHWNGASWSATPTPDFSPLWSRFEAVAMVATDDVWAVGRTDNIGRGIFTALVEQWNGSTWSSVALPKLQKNSQLLGVAALAADDVWAVGSQGSETLTLHYNGAMWKEVPAPSPGPYGNVLAAVHAVSANKVFAVGSYQTGGLGTKTALVQQWNGSSWAVKKLPRTKSESFLEGVSALGGKDVWAVGRSGVKTLTLHKTADGWSKVPSPSFGTQSDRLEGVVAFASDDVWAAGTTYSDDAQDLVLHWDGSSWSSASVPQPGPSAQLFGIGGSTSTDVWAVGFGSSATGYAQTLRYC